MKVKLFVAFIVLCIMVACSGGNKPATSSSSGEVSYSSTDYSVTYYLPQNISKFQNDEPYTTADLKESGSLLFTQNGLVKAIEFASGWQKVNHFTKRTAVSGRWWLYMIYYDGISQENEMDVYVPM